MKNQKTAIIAAMAAIIILAGGCKKNNLSKTDYLTKGAWKWTSISASGTETIENCDKDNVDTYTSNGTYNINIGSDSCSVDDEGGPGVWKFIDNEGKIVYD